MATRNGLRKFRLANAKRLRSNTTQAERMLWRTLRQIEQHGTHFRRQVAIGCYVADFACLKSKLIIELDGSQHSQPHNIASDDERTRWLEAEGYRVLRFWNSDLYQNLAGVMEVIHSHADHPTPARCAVRPSPSRGG